MQLVHQSSLFWKLVLPVPIALIFVVTLTIVFLPDYLADNARQDAVHSAQQTAEQFKTFRGYYTTSVIGKVLEDGSLEPSINHKNMEKGIPLPATVIHDMSELLAEKGISIKLTSPYPFPNRSSRILDAFQQDAWDFLVNNPGDVFVRNLIENGTEIVRIGIADTMVSPACVNCHNSRADSPKIDWKLGDLRGILEINADIGPQLERGAAVNRVILISSMGIGLILSLISVITAFQISKPIQTITFVMGKMAEGVTDLDVPAKSRKDEVGAIAKAVEIFRRGIIRQKYLQDQIQLSEGRYKDFANSSSDWFWETDSELRFSYVSGRSEQVLGLKQKDVIGKNREEVHSGNLDKDSLAWNRHLQCISDHLPFTDYEFHWRRPDGGERFISLSGAPNYDNQGTFMGYRGIGRDISNRKQLEEQIRRAQKMDAVGQLTGGIAHDFNNILGIIQGNLELLKNMMGKNDAALKRMDKAFEGINRGASITKKLLGFSRKNPSRISLTSPNEFIENLKDLIAKSLTASIKVESHLAEGLWTVAIDPGDLEDALLNLSLNARDAMPDGGTLTINTENKRLDEEYAARNREGRAGDFVMISVSDTGFGMAADIKRKVLEPFFTTKEQGKGTGLGLSMVYGFVQRSKGQINIYSEVGQGTIVRLYLPRAKELTTEKAPKVKKSVEIPAGKETVLVVDDEEALRDIAVSHLGDLGYQTLTAANADEALEVLAEYTSIELVFSDVVMPGRLNGYQLAKKVQQKFPSTKFLLTSGFTKTHEGQGGGQDDYSRDLSNHLLNKPYNKSELALAVRHRLDDQK